ncbi:hypothetical protein SynRS9909_00348 [Synechococcus sp. RS9909]|nr:hypothetical protein SynRS9909_00348 [Synechococcus sp. RS9909]
MEPVELQDPIAASGRFARRVTSYCHAVVQGLSSLVGHTP